MTPDYNDVESPANFRTNKELADYRAMLLRKTAPQAELIAQTMGGRPFSCLELCCGNGRLLVDLASRGLLTRGTGIDAAESRIKFGQKWLEDECLAGVNLVVGDVRHLPALGTQDVTIMITGAFQYFHPSAVGEILDQMIAAAPYCVLELYNIPQERAVLLGATGGQLKTWGVLPPEDPFAYYLDNYLYLKDLNMIRHEKVFIRRDGKIDAGRVENLWYYGDDEVCSRLHDAGYNCVAVYADWDRSIYTPTSDKMIIIGKAI